MPHKKSGLVSRPQHNHTFSNPYDVLLSKLQLNYVPDSLPCRDDMKKLIREFIASGLRDRGSSSSMYISGMPGTGKTATTLEVIKKMNMERKQKFKFIHVNGMQLNNSSVIYSLIYKEISGSKHKPTTAAVLLDDYFKSRKNLKEDQLKDQKMIVLLVDELDALVTKKQTLLYNLFDWPSHKNSGLVILAIANTMDLPERFLVKIKSRIGETRLVYQPYNRDQIEKIIKARMSDTDIFKKDSVRVVASKISSLSGDIRRALQVCRRATEMAKAEWDKQRKENKGDKIIDVSVSHVQKACIELYNSKNTLLLKALRKYEKIVIISIMIETLMDHQDKVKLPNITTRIYGISEAFSYDKLTQGEIMEILLRLKAFGMIGITNEKPLLFKTSHGSGKARDGSKGVSIHQANSTGLRRLHIQSFVYPDEIHRAYEHECDIFEKYKDMISYEKHAY
jgi:Cdc6-like AAA superfamily ATPase